MATGYRTTWPNYFHCCTRLVSKSEDNTGCNDVTNGSDMRPGSMYFDLESVAFRNPWKLSPLAGCTRLRV